MRGRLRRYSLGEPSFMAATCLRICAQTSYTRQSGVLDRLHTDSKNASVTFPTATSSALRSSNTSSAVSTSPSWQHASISASNTAARAPRRRRRIRPTVASPALTRRARRPIGTDEARAMSLRTERAAAEMSDRSAAGVRTSLGGTRGSRARAAAAAAGSPRTGHAGPEAAGGGSCASQDSSADQSIEPRWNRRRRRGGDGGPAGGHTGGPRRRRRRRRRARVLLLLVPRSPRPRLVGDAVRGRAVEHVRGASQHAPRLFRVHRHGGVAQGLHQRGTRGAIRAVSHAAHALMQGPRPIHLSLRGADAYQFAVVGARGAYRARPSTRGFEARVRRTRRGTAREPPFQGGAFESSSATRELLHLVEHVVDATSFGDDPNQRVLTLIVGTHASLVHLPEECVRVLHRALSAPAVHEIARRHALSRHPNVTTAGATPARFIRSNVSNASSGAPLRLRVDERRVCERVWRTGGGIRLVLRRTTRAPRRVPHRRRARAPPPPSDPRTCARFERRRRRAYPREVRRARGSRRRSARRDERVVRDGVRRAEEEEDADVAPRFVVGVGGRRVGDRFHRLVERKRAIRSSDGGVQRDGGVAHRRVSDAAGGARSKSSNASHASEERARYSPSSSAAAESPPPPRQAVSTDARVYGSRGTPRLDMRARASSASSRAPLARTRTDARSTRRRLASASDDFPRSSNGVLRGPSPRADATCQRRQQARRRVIIRAHSRVSRALVRLQRPSHALRGGRAVRGGERRAVGPIGSLQPRGPPPTPLSAALVAGRSFARAAAVMSEFVRARSVITRARIVATVSPRARDRRDERTRPRIWLKTPSSHAPASTASRSASVAVSSLPALPAALIRPEYAYASAGRLFRA